VRGLTIRWQLRPGDSQVLTELATFIEASSFARFSELPGLQSKVWRAVPGSWFEGTYVFQTSASREAFEQEFRAQAASAAGSRIIGEPPVLIEPCEIVAVVAGAAGFKTFPPSGAGFPNGDLASR
jgi:hypothetical protein